MDFVCFSGRSVGDTADLRMVFRLLTLHPLLQRPKGLRSLGTREMVLKRLWHHSSGTSVVTGAAGVCICDSNARHTSSVIIKRGSLVFPGNAQTIQTAWRNLKPRDPIRNGKLRVLAMVYNTWDYWAFRLFPLSGVLKNTTFRKQISFRPQIRGWETPALLVPLERANLSHWSSDLRTQQSVSDPLTWGRKQIRSETPCSLEYRLQRAISQVASINFVRNSTKQIGLECVLCLS
jgi:hypothetical protein